MKTLYTTLLALCATAMAHGQSFNTGTAVSGLQYPVAFEVAPDGRFFITEKGNGGTANSTQKSRIQVYAANGTLSGTFFDLSDSTNSNSERGVLGIALDPAFASNHYVYVYYNHRRGGDERIRIVRFTEASNTGTNPKIIFDLDVADNIPGNHVGGNIHFRPSEASKIYMTLGDLGLNQTNAGANYANKLNNPYGKLLRINTDGSIPADNPYYDDGNPLSGNCDWIWSYGHRNPFDFCFGPNDSLYCSENGLNTWDEANLIRKGGYYGWADCEGYYQNGSTTNTCTAAGAIPPIVDWGSPLPSVTGILFYRGTGWSALNNHLLVADYVNGRIHDCTLGNAPYYSTVSGKSVLGDFSSGGLTALKQSPEGCIYAMEGGYTTNGKIYKICPMDVGISEQQNVLSAIRLYPNPASDLLHVTFENASGQPLRLQLHDLLGKTIWQGVPEVTRGTNTLELDIRALGIPHGIYLLQFRQAENDGVLGTLKLAVE